ncbi:MAG TPA: hypothetical protein PLL69_09010, partial [Gemmatimonadales bacterium]|nr:hypothetical protein [Gemmatimonadales bacterium]
RAYMLLRVAQCLPQQAAAVHRIVDNDAAILGEAGGLARIASGSAPAELARIWGDWLRDDELRTRAGRAALEIISADRGAAARSAVPLTALL